MPGEVIVSIYDLQLNVRRACIAMGTPVAVAFAILFMYALQIDLVIKFKARGWLKVYKRFIDDIFAVLNCYGTAHKFWLEF